MRMSTNPVMRWVALGYVWLFRGMPAILQLLLWFNLALVFPTIGIHGVWEARMVDVMTPFVAALLGLGINQGAYSSEVVRAGLLSVDTGQYEAAKAIAMARLKALRRIILPQAMRVIIPPIGNEFISMVKLTSLASVIQYAEILHNAENIYYANSRVIELLIVAGDLVPGDRHPPFGGSVPDRGPLRPRRRATGCGVMSPPIVKAVSLNKHYGQFQALTDIDIEVFRGEVLCIIGPSGSGKSTLLRCVNLLSPPVTERRDLPRGPGHGGQRPGVGAPALQSSVKAQTSSRQRARDRHGVPAVQPLSRTKACCRTSPKAPQFKCSATIEGRSDRGGERPRPTGARRASRDKA